MFTFCKILPCPRCTPIDLGGLAFATALEIHDHVLRLPSRPVCDVEVFT